MAQQQQQVTDHLREDPALPGQSWAVVSFVNPKDKVTDKQLFYINKFLVSEVNKSIVAQGLQMAKKLQSMMRKRIDDVLERLKLSVDEEDKVLYRLLNSKYGEMQIDEEEFIDECHRQYTLDTEELLDSYKMYIAENRTGLDKDYDEANEYITSVRGFKVRGNFNRYEDACARCEFLRENVEQSVHAYVVPVGQWFPIDMEADEVQDQDYMLPELNNLMGKYHEGMRNKDRFFSQRKQELMTTPAESRSDKIRRRLRKKQEEKKKAQMKAEVEAYKSASK